MLLACTLFAEDVWYAGLKEVLQKNTPCPAPHDSQQQCMPCQVSKLVWGALLNIAMHQRSDRPCPLIPCRCRRVGQPASAGPPAAAAGCRSQVQAIPLVAAMSPPTGPPATGPSQILHGQSRWCQVQQQAASRCSATQQCMLPRHLSQHGLQSVCSLQETGPAVVLVVLVPQTMARGREALTAVGCPVHLQQQQGWCRC